jgi:acetyl esterase/lipase
VLFCGLYDTTTMSVDGPFADFTRTVIWSYLGSPDPNAAHVERMAVTPDVTPAYPPAFISVGNTDPLAPQSAAFAEALRAQVVEVDALFFPNDHNPPLGHEYQMLLSIDAGQLALDRAVAFLEAHAK